MEIQNDAAFTLAECHARMMKTVTPLIRLVNIMLLHPCGMFVLKMGCFGELWHDRKGTCVVPEIMERIYRP